MIITNLWGGGVHRNTQTQPLIEHLFSTIIRNNKEIKIFETHPLYLKAKKEELERKEFERFVNRA